jgi:hypothetical protein
MKYTISSFSFTTPDVNDHVSREESLPNCTQSSCHPITKARAQQGKKRGLMPQTAVRKVLMRGCQSLLLPRHPVREICYLFSLIHIMHGTRIVEKLRSQLSSELRWSKLLKLVSELVPSDCFNFP